MKSFYLQLPQTNKGIILIPTCEFECFLGDLNQKYALRLKIPPGKNAKLFRFSFPPKQMPQPRYLGQPLTVACYDHFRANIPQTKHKNFPENRFTAKIYSLLAVADDVNLSHGKKSKKDKAHKAPERRKKWGRTTKRVQRYLGLRKKKPSSIRTQPCRRSM